MIEADGRQVPSSRSPVREKVLNASGGGEDPSAAGFLVPS